MSRLFLLQEILRTETAGGQERESVEAARATLQEGQRQLRQHQRQLSSEQVGAPLAA
jgi:hypothetical protein